MKIVLIIAGILVVLFILFQIYTAMATEKSETQAYKVIEVKETFEVRYYPSATMAMITSSARTFKELGSSGFTKLAGYIFGGNKDKKRHCNDLTGTYGYRRFCFQYELCNAFEL